MIRMGIAAATAVVLLAGCSDGRPTRVPVSGTVTFQGEPLASANVTFLSTQADGHSASGRTDDSGQFKLTTFSPDDGAIPGDYVVTIAMHDSRGAEIDVGAADQDLGADYEAMMMGEASSGGAQAQPGGLPAKYANASESGLTETVTEGKKNVIDIELD